MPHKQTLQRPTPGPSGTQWSEDFFREPSQHNETPILGPIQSSKSPVPSHEPEPEVAPTQSTEEPFACPATPRSVIIIDNMPFGSSPEIPTASSSPGPSSPHSHNEAWQEFTDL
ncbi:hypothetical protein O181_016039 [Austropuccinia psidii MF-1]|uniref:Uncharacterized protein n=1 Tax=Austropuccinia psidii MF-1 TaxID=1389203 RepID=A0A9Q3C0Z2_9BASI|nr:hypothetical protein [Austropuccinia psidii MF-1]